MNWYEPTAAAILDLWQAFVLFIPKLVGALLVFLIGWMIAVGIGKLVSEILRKAKLNSIFEKGHWKQAMEKAQFKLDPAGFIGAIFKWVLAIVFLMAAVEILGLYQFAEFLKNIIAYLPNVIVAALIFVVTVIVADFLEKIIRASVESVKIGYGKFISLLVKWSIWIFAILTILYQLKIAPELIQTLFTGVVALFVIAGGIAFGLGGKEFASELLQELKRKLG